LVCTNVGLVALHRTENKTERAMKQTNCANFLIVQKDLDTQCILAVKKPDLKPITDKPD